MGTKYKACSGRGDRCDKEVQEKCCLIYHPVYYYTMRIEELKSRFEQFLKQRGHKITKGRLGIIHKIADYGTHFEIEELVRWIANQDRYVASRSTIYRTIRLLQEFGAVREVIKLGNRTIYEFVAGKPHHEHLICIKCGKIIEFYREEIEELQDRVCEEHSFMPINHRLEIFGICSDCGGKINEDKGMEGRA